MRPLRVAYGLIGCFFVVERLLRQGEGAKSFREGEADQGSTRAVGAAFGVALLTLLVAPLLNGRGIGRFGGERVAWGGVVAMLAGLALRTWATQVLGSFYTRTLRTEAEQRLIAEGPYRVVRHPGYLGSVLLWLGAGIATGNWIAVMAISFPVLGGYWYRMRAEEAMLAEAFPGEYESYARRTWRVVPFVY